MVRPIAKGDRTPNDLPYEPQIGAPVKRTLTKKLAVATGAAALAFGAVACDAENDGLDPAQEDPMMEDDGFGDDTLEDDTLEDDTLEDDGAEG
jgi:hypothetical protein